ncbi:DegV family protein [Lachnobacterium bovis]|jgi:DegV family protein with EDD domain|uniref:EDD domain protein, DegV family n=1 Tax=Lachnobacterium bovis DSM 14045 TaxID=1122142 RepID=A0A1H3IBZ9_9FIRM|nr:DegV family protein [Lachnobacterium bovis]SDY24618.1 EDD domain protein, DegV family [Lachnobacterium bovis DSM 14045]
MYKIIIDSCGELTEELKKDGHFVNVPLELEIDGYHIVDDETFDQLDFIKRVEESPVGPKSACPSPERYMKEFEGDYDDIFVVTLSSKLSGSYNSAILAKNLYEDENGTEKNIYVVNSRSASIGQTVIGMKIQEFEEQGMPFDEIVKKIEEYTDSINTFFVLETLETLRKAGRLSNVKAFIANTLNIKPVMGSTDEGSIQQLGQGRGMKKALAKMVDCIAEVTPDSENRRIAISQCNCPERAEYVKKLLEEKLNFKEIIIVPTAGVSTMYANNGGIVVAG